MGNTRYVSQQELFYFLGFFLFFGFFFGLKNDVCFDKIIIILWEVRYVKITLHET